MSTTERLPEPYRLLTCRATASTSSALIGRSLVDDALWRFGALRPLLDVGNHGGSAVRTPADRPVAPFKWTRDQIPRSEGNKTHDQRPWVPRDAVLGFDQDIRWAAGDGKMGSGQDGMLRQSADGKREPPRTGVANLSTPLQSPSSLPRHIQPISRAAPGSRSTASPPPSAKSTTPTPPFPLIHRKDRLVVAGSCHERELYNIPAPDSLFGPYAHTWPPIYSGVRRLVVTRRAMALHPPGTGRLLASANAF
jgi:hypothetical protein